jgi:hypothetical protein
MDRKLISYSLSELERGRIREPAPDPKDLSSFSTLEAHILHSLSPAKLFQTRTPAGSRLPTPRTLDRPFEDEALLKKLIQYRNQIPLSPRIIRSRES